MSKLVTQDAILSFPGAADYSANRGFFVRFDGTNDRVALIATPASQRPLGVIVDGQPTTGLNSVALSGSGLVVKVKCAASAGTINPGTLLQLNGTTLGTVSADSGTGGRVIVAKALEAGANDALIDAVLLPESVLT